MAMEIKQQIGRVWELSCHKRCWRTNSMEISDEQENENVINSPFLSFYVFTYTVLYAVSIQLSIPFGMNPHTHTHRWCAREKMVYGLQTEKRNFHQITIHHRTIHFMLAFFPQFLPNELKIRKTASSSFLPFLVFLLLFLYEKGPCIHHSFPFFRFTFYHTSKEHR